MQQCDSVFIVKYYGSYFKNTDLWVREKKYGQSCMNCRMIWWNIGLGNKIIFIDLDIHLRNKLTVMLYASILHEAY